MCCGINILLTCLSSVLLMVAMFMKVATFQGDILNITVVAVSLYFVFELDDKVMDSDPKLRPRFGSVVLKQSCEQEYKPTWINTIAAYTSHLIKLSIPFGLFMIVFISWRQVSE